MVTLFSHHQNVQKTTFFENKSRQGCNIFDGRSDKDRVGNRRHQRFQCTKPFASSGPYCPHSKYVGAIDIVSVVVHEQ